MAAGAASGARIPPAASWALPQPPGVAGGVLASPAQRPSLLGSRGLWICQPMGVVSGQPFCRCWLQSQLWGLLRNGLGTSLWGPRARGTLLNLTWDPPALRLAFRPSEHSQMKNWKLDPRGQTRGCGGSDRDRRGVKARGMVPEGMGDSQLQGWEGELIPLPT